MIISYTHQDNIYQFDLSNPIDISIPLREGHLNPNCYFSDPPVFETIKAEGFIGSVQEGGPCNHRKITFTPHGNGTHTECYGHISPDPEAHLPIYIVNSIFLSRLITLTPIHKNGDELITREQIAEALSEKFLCPALIIRTLPNPTSKKTKNYSGTNPPYFEAKATQWMAQNQVNHLLIDLPSIDKEVDGGKLEAHKAFWQYPDSPRKQATITELIYVPDNVQDGLYLLCLQTSSFMNDAVPSRPIIYENIIKP